MAVQDSLGGDRLSSSGQLLQHYRALSQRTLTIVDLETTGHGARTSRVTEVSVLQASLENGILNQHTQLMNPEVPIPAAITQFTGISQAMVDAAPVSEQVWPQFLPRLREHVLTAHNLSFDYAFLQAEYEDLGIVFEREPGDRLCTVELSRLMLSDLPSRRLPDLVQHFGFRVGRSHRAEADALACWLLAERLLGEIRDEADEVLLAKFGRQWIRLRDAAALLNLSTHQARQVLQAAQLTVQTGRTGTLLYRRSQVDQVVAERRSAEP